MGFYYTGATRDQDARILSLGFIDRATDDGTITLTTPRGFP